MPWRKHPQLAHIAGARQELLAMPVTAERSEESWRKCRCGLDSSLRSAVTEIRRSRHSAKLLPSLSKLPTRPTPHEGSAAGVGGELIKPMRVLGAPTAQDRPVCPARANRGPRPVRSPGPLDRRGGPQRLAGRQAALGAGQRHGQRQVKAGALPGLKSVATATVTPAAISRRPLTGRLRR